MKLKTLKKRLALCRKIKKQRGGSVLCYYIDAAYCSAVHGASPENYYVLRFFEKSNAEREKFLTSGRSKECDRILNLTASAADRQALAYKHRFDEVFSDFVKRDFLYAPDADEALFNAFLDRHEQFFLKPDSGTMGQGIKKLHSSEIADRADFYARCVKNKLLLEEGIVQHSALEAISPGCVCTVRVNTVRGKILGACLKCGGAGSVTDNFHSGGVAYPLDVRTGEIIGPGRDNSTLRDYYEHPASGRYMPGFVLPHIEKIQEMLPKACAIVPTIGYIGWDIAVTENGAELIEGNFSWPGGNIIQFDNIGKYQRLKSLMETET